MFELLNTKNKSNSIVPEEVPREYHIIYPVFESLKLPDLQSFICERNQFIYKETISHLKDEATNRTFSYEKVINFTCELMQFQTPNKIHMRYTIGKGMHSPTPDVATIGQIYKVYADGEREFVEESDELYFENSRNNQNQFKFFISPDFNKTQITLNMYGSD